MLLKISKENNTKILITGDVLSEDIYVTQKLTGKRLYNEAPEYLPIKLINQKKGYVTIPIRERKYGNVFEIKGISDNIQIDFDKNLNKVGSFQFKFNQEIILERFKMKQIASNRFYIEGGSGEKLTLYARRRIFPNNGDEYAVEECEIQTEDRYVQISFIDLSERMSLTDRDIVDFFIKTPSGKYINIYTDSLENEWKSAGSNLKYILYKTKINTFALRVATNVRRYISDAFFDIEDDSIVIQLSSPVRDLDVQIENVRFVEFNKSGTREQHGSSLQYQMHENTIKLDLNHFVGELSRGRCKYNGYLTFYESNAVIRSVLKLPQVASIHSSTKNMTLKVTQNDLGEAIFNFLLVINPEPVRIAVLGSSHTRPMFTSSSYYNPDYKRYFSVVYTQFHSSIRSLVSNQPINFEEKMYPNRPQTSLKYVRTDLEKTFWQDLKKENADYFLLDIYIDVQMGVFEFGDGRIISYNSYQAESDFVVNNANLGVKLSTIQNDSKYFEKFSAAVKIFKQKILSIFKEDQIIIHLFDMNFEYKSKGGLVSEYSQKKHTISRLNYDATRLQQVLTECFSRARILDTRNGPWIGDENMPLGNMPHHYESKYYKNMFTLFLKVIAGEK